MGKAIITICILLSLYLITEYIGLGGLFVTILIIAQFYNQTIIKLVLNIIGIIGFIGYLYTVIPEAYNVYVIGEKPQVVYEAKPNSDLKVEMNKYKENKKDREEVRNSLLKIAFVTWEEYLVPGK